MDTGCSSADTSLADDDEVVVNSLSDTAAATGNVGSVAIALDSYLSISGKKGCQLGGAKELMLTNNSNNQS
jgi:hypothetical protein